MDRLRYYLSALCFNEDCCGTPDPTIDPYFCWECRKHHRVTVKHQTYWDSPNFDTFCLPCHRELFVCELCEDRQWPPQKTLVCAYDDCCVMCRRPSVVRMELTLVLTIMPRNLQLLVVAYVVPVESNLARWRRQGRLGGGSIVV